MGQLHNELRRGVWSEALKNALGASKGEGGIERYGETIDPVLDLWELPEWAWLRKETLGAVHTGQAAVAAEFGFTGIGIPTGARDILVVERCKARAGMNVQLGLIARSVVAGTGTLSGTNTQARDSRFHPGLTVSRNPPVEVWVGSDPGSIVGGLTEEIVPTATTFEEFFSTPHIVKPGFVLVVQGSSVNVLINVDYVFRVRNALPGELVV